MESIPAELFPLQPWNGPGPPELADEDALLQKLAVEPIAPAATRAYAHRHFYMYFLLFVAFIVLPGAIFGLNFLFEQGLPRWMARTGIFFTLGAFFVLFYAILALLISRTKVLRHLGIVPTKPSAGVTQDVSILAKRKGRTLEYGVDEAKNFWRYRQAVPELRIEYRGGQFLVSPGLPPRVESLLSRLPPDRKWDRLQIQGDAGGLRSFRPVRKAKYFLQDLWLFEEILKALEK